MTDNTQEQTPNPEDKGLPPGITTAVTGDDKRGDGAPNAPVINNAPPAKEQTPEEKALAVKAAEEAAAKTAKDEADKKVLDDAEAAKKAEEALAAESEYMDYGDANANAVVDILREAKIPVQEAHELFKEAVETGDFSKIDAAKLTEKLGKAKADLVLLGVKTYYESATQATKKTVDAVHTEVGGKANYDKVQNWARALSDKDPAFAAKMEGLNAMFDLNTTAAVMAAKELVALYNKDGNNSSLTTKQVNADKAFTTDDSGSEYLSRNDYLAKMKEANAKNDQHEINRLRAQRAASLPSKR